MSDVLIEKITALIEPSIEDLGYELVRVNVRGQGKSQILQIMAEPKEDRLMTVEDCSKISRELSALLDVEDPLEAAYHLEVSSPGLDRPLTRLKDFETYKNYVAKIETKMLVDGRRRFAGRLQGTQGDVISIETDDEIYQIDFSNVHRSKLVITDELLAEAKALQDSNDNQA